MHTCAGQQPVCSASTDERVSWALEAVALLLALPPFETIPALASGGKGVCAGVGGGCGRECVRCVSMSKRVKVFFRRRCIYGRKRTKCVPNVYVWCVWCVRCVWESVVCVVSLVWSWLHREESARACEKKKAWEREHTNVYAGESVREKRRGRGTGTGTGTGGGRGRDWDKRERERGRERERLKEIEKEIETETETETETQIETKIETKTGKETETETEMETETQQRQRQRGRERERER